MGYIKRQSERVNMVNVIWTFTNALASVPPGGVQPIGMLYIGPLKITSFGLRSKRKMTPKLEPNFTHSEVISLIMLLLLIRTTDCTRKGRYGSTTRSFVSDEWMWQVCSQMMVLTTKRTNKCQSGGNINRLRATPRVQV